MEKFNSISKLVEDGVYEIHHNYNKDYSGLILVKDGVLTDVESNTVYTDEDIWNVECFEEENIVHYIKR